jgi:hypothetical protein
MVHRIWWRRPEISAELLGLAALPVLTDKSTHSEGSRSTRRVWPSFRGGPTCDEWGGGCARCASVSLAVSRTARHVLTCGYHALSRGVAAAGERAGERDRRVASKPKLRNRGSNRGRDGLM